MGRKESNQTKTNKNLFYVLILVVKQCAARGGAADSSILSVAALFAKIELIE